MARSTMRLYVATLIRLAEARAGHGFRRSVLFAAFTGEEKGLLGATWFVAHPTVTRELLVADINLDQLRPLFPLKALTMHGIADTSLGAVAARVAGPMGIELRADREPDRGLNHRADHWPFLEAGIPATGFVFGYDAGRAAEGVYREWYRTRYHRPQDDLGQPFDAEAARGFQPVLLPSDRRGSGRCRAARVPAWKSAAAALGRFGKQHIARRTPLAPQRPRFARERARAKRADRDFTEREAKMMFDTGFGRDAVLDPVFERKEQDQERREAPVGRDGEAAMFMIRADRDVTQREPADAKADRHARDPRQYSQSAMADAQNGDHAERADNRWNDP